MAGEARYREARQYRTRPPTAYETALGDALEATFAAGVRDLPGIVRRLNEAGLKAPDGRDWTEAAFPSAIKKLADA
jgi:hypothetical protein